MTDVDAVSSENEKLIAVDGNDREIGQVSKAMAHDGEGTLHRAFSIFLFNDKGEVLLQQRSADKRLWPLYWSNTCCSHPRVGEDISTATVRRLEQELGMQSDLTYLFKFQYQAKFGPQGSENELCSVYVGQAIDEPQLHPREIAAVKWLSVEAVTRELAADTKGERYTPWFNLEWRRLVGEFGDRLSEFKRT
ncbi:MAG: isopentenyl-diphosphate Delta-isomerase [Clostridia bacterium]|nr:isopentenyl-diphosphate Delta-isomerase [Deltaproteobacteria bacterium]